VALRQQYSLVTIAQQLGEIIESGEPDEYSEELLDLQYWLTVERFDRPKVNRRLQQYTCGDEACQWE
jgi:hypothetical protein